MPKKILIIEDERDVASLVADVLDLEGFESRIAAGERALSEARAFRPDAILLDLMMPGLDGFAVARHLQAEPDIRHIPIVVMTAMHDAAARAAELGTEYVLAKPFDIGDLLQLVRQLTAEQP